MQTYFIIALIISCASAFQVSRPVHTISSMRMQATETFEPPEPVPAPKKKVALAAKWLPFGGVKAPKVLDGTLAGDAGFDPAGFAGSTKTLYWMREAEVKHARLAMLGAAGWPLSELWHKNLAGFFGLDSILANGDRAPSLLNGGLSNPWALSTLILAMVGTAYLENKAMDKGGVFWADEKPEGYVSGDFGFDPLGLYNKKGGDKMAMQTAEIKNGRLAMIAITAFVFQEVFSGLSVVNETPYLF